MPIINLFSFFLSSHFATKKHERSQGMAGQVYCMVMRVSVDCNACCRKMKRILLNMKEIEKHLIEKQHYRVSVSGKFVPADVAIKIRKKMKRRVEILEVRDLSDVSDHAEENSPTIVTNNYMQGSGFCTW